MTALDSEIAADLIPVAHFCASLPPGPIAAHTQGDDSFALVHAHSDENVGPVQITVDRYVAWLRQERLERDGEPCGTVFEASLPEGGVRLSRTLGC